MKLPCPRRFSVPVWRWPWHWLPWWRCPTLPRPPSPSPVSVADVAPRHFGDGGPAVESLVRAGASAQLPDGTKVFWDQGAFSIRRVDGDGTMSTLAGTGREPGPAQTCRIDTGADARQVP